MLALAGDPHSAQGRGSHVGKEASIAALTLHVTQHQCLSSMAVCASSWGIPGFKTPHYQPLKLSAHSQQ